MAELKSAGAPVTAEKKSQTSWLVSYEFSTLHKNGYFIFSISSRSLCVLLPW